MLVGMPLFAFIQPDVQRNNLFNRIALCESGNNELAKNPDSSATGRFQFLKSTWKRYGEELWGKDYYEKNIEDYNDNTELAFYVFSTYGTKDWNASKTCWDSLGQSG